MLPSILCRLVDRQIWLRIVGNTAANEFTLDASRPFARRINGPPRQSVDQPGQGEDLSSTKTSKIQPHDVSPVEYFHPPNNHTGEISKSDVVPPLTNFPGSLKSRHEPISNIQPSPHHHTHTHEHHHHAFKPEIRELVRQGSSKLKSLLPKVLLHHRDGLDDSKRESSIKIHPHEGRLTNDGLAEPPFIRRPTRTSFLHPNNIQRQHTHGGGSIFGDRMGSGLGGRRPSHAVTRIDNDFTFVPKSIAVPDAPDRVAPPLNRRIPSILQQTLQNKPKQQAASAAASFMITARLKQKAQSIRNTRREQRHRKMLEAQNILLRHRNVLQQYNIRTVNTTNNSAAIPELTGFKRFLILPTSTWYKGWQLLTLCIVLHQSVYIPYSLSFEASNATPPTGTPLTNFVTIVFAFDMIFAFNTAISDPDYPDTLITNRWFIARAYLSGWFLLDLLACVPIDMIVFFATSGENASSTTGFSVFALLKVLRLPRLLRLARLVRILRLLHIPPQLKRWLLYSRYAHLIRVVQLIIAFLYSTHIMNCLWNALHPEWVDDVFDNNIVSNIYILGFYYTLTTLMGQSIALRTEDQYIFSCALIVVGALLMAMVFGNVSDLISNFNESQNNYRKKMEQLLCSMNLMHLPLDLQNRINEYYQFMWERHGTLDGQPLVFTNELSKNLAVEVELFVRMDMINRVPVFQKCSKKVVQDIVMNLQLQVYLPGDFIVVKGEVGTDMYFVQNGECQVTKTSNLNNEMVEILKTLIQGDYFGEIALLMNCKRTANVRANIFSELCVLSRKIFEEITEKYIEDREMIEKFITEMYDPKVLDAIMKQQAFENPEKTFHARMTSQMSEIFDYMEDTSYRFERLETLIETLLYSFSEEEKISSKRETMIDILNKRRNSSIEIEKNIKKSINIGKNMLEALEKI